MEYRIAETFISVNGEGTRSGQLALFIRFAGCNLNCSYCDTAWANEEDTPVCIRTEEEICELTAQSGIRNVTITGGEPLIQPGMHELLTKISAGKDLRIEIETNGSVSLSSYSDLPPNVSFTLDYKLKGSGQEASMQTDNLKLLRMQDTVKFVVSDREDLEHAHAIIREYDLSGRCHIMISPVFGRIRPEKIVEYMKEKRLNDVNLQLQIHKVIWNPMTKGV